MDFDLFKKIIDEYSVSPFSMVSPQFQGEPLMYPKFLEACEYMNRMGVQFRFNTNGTIMDRLTIKPLSIMECFHSVVFSIDGTKDSTFEEIRVGANFNLVMENVIDFIEVSNKPCWINFTIMPENFGELDRFVSYWTGHGVPVTSAFVTDLNGRPTKFHWNSSVRFPCIPDSMIILTNGDVVPCCRDHWGKMVMGNAWDQTIQEIWFGKKYQDLREMQKAKKWDYLKLCSDCDTWMTYVGFAPRERKFLDGIMVKEYPFWAEYWRSGK